MSGRWGIRMETRYVNTIISAYSVFAWISAFVFFIAALALTFLSPFAVTFLIDQNPASIPPGVSALAFQQLATGLAVIAGVVLFMIAAFFLAIGVGLWRRNNWARYLALVPCVIWIFAFPVGTLVGIVGIYAFAFDKDVRAQFQLIPAARVVTKKKR